MPELVYNELPLIDVLLTLLGVASIYVIYLLRKIFPFNIIWMLLLGIFIYALLGYAGNKVKEWWKK